MDGKHSLLNRWVALKAIPWAVGVGMIAATSHMDATGQIPGLREKPAPPLQYPDEWDGPFADTKILKMVDTEEGVVCYIYAHVKEQCTERKSPFAGDQTPIQECARVYPSGVGSMSCVKVGNDRASAGSRRPAPRAREK